MKKIIFVMLLFTFGFALRGDDYVGDRRFIERELTRLDDEKQDIARQIFTTVPADTDGVTGEIRLVNLGSGTSFYMYVKFDETTWKRYLQDD